MKTIEEILRNAKVIAVVGLSPKPGRASASVAQYMASKGYTIIPVNPMYEEIMGQKSYPGLLDIPKDIKVDIVDVFRKSEDTPATAREAVEINASCLWLQLDIANEESKQIATAAGLDYVEDKCIKIEHYRYLK